MVRIVFRCRCSQVEPHSHPGRTNKSMATIEQIITDLESVKSAHAANVAAIAASVAAQANVQSVTLDEQRKVDSATVAQSKAVFDAQAKATVSASAAAVAAALLKSSLERLDADLEEYVPGSGLAGPPGPQGPAGKTGATGATGAAAR